MANPITDIEIRELLTQSDILDAQDAGIIPDGSYTLRNEEVTLQNREIYEWLKSKNDPRFIDTTLSSNTNQEDNVSPNDTNQDDTNQGDNVSLGDTMKKYTVVKGDYLYKIARLYPIDGISESKRVDQIYKANPYLKGRRIESNDKTYFHGKNYLQNKNLLFPGMNSTVRIRSKVRYLTCGECGEIKRKNLGVKNE